MPASDVRLGPPQINQSADSVSRGAGPEVAIALALGLLGISFAGTTALAVVIATTSGIAALLGRPRIILFAMGLSILCVASDRLGVMTFPAILIATLIGMVAHAGRHYFISRRAMMTFALMAVLAILYILNPPTTGTGVAAGAALLFVPLGLLVMDSVTYLPRTSSHDALWLAAGLSTSVGYGLTEAYQTILNPASTYATVRVFESVIGSSNSAAAKATTVGLLLLSIAALKHRAPVKLAWTFLAVPFLIAPAMMASRGSLLGIFAGLLVLAISRPNGLRFRVGRIALLASGTLAAILVARSQNWFLWERVINGFQSDDLTAGRTELYRTSIRLILEQPLTGQGVGRFNELLYQTFEIAYSHNFLLDIYGQLGLILGSIYIFAITPKNLRTTSVTGPALIAVFVISLVEPFITTPTGAIVFIGLMAANYAETKADRRLSKEWQ